MVSDSSSASSSDWLADLARHLLERRLDRHARLHADQQHVERVREGVLDRGLAALHQVLDEHVGQVEADVAGADGKADLDQHRIVVVGDHEQIEQGDDGDDHRHGHAEEHVGDERRLSAQARHLQLVAHLLGLEHAAQIELVDDLLHEALGRGPAAGPGRPSWRDRRGARRASCRARSPSPACGCSGGRATAPASAP